MIKAIIVDDERHCIDTLSVLLQEYCPQVQILEKCRSSTAAVVIIQKLKPQLLFLDIEMPGMNGFELLEQFDEIIFPVIFTTGYDRYAIKAIHLSAMDYLLKPVNPKELIAAVNKVQTQNRAPSTEQFQLLFNQVQHRDAGFNKVAVPTADGFELLDAGQILRCKADSNYTYIFLKNKTKITACRNMKEMEEQLNIFTTFLRVHHSYIVNLNEVTRYVRGEGGYVVMSDGATVDVSRSKKELLIRKLLPNKE